MYKPIQFMYGGNCIKTKKYVENQSKFLLLAADKNFIYNQTVYSQLHYKKIANIVGIFANSRLVTHFRCTICVDLRKMTVD